MPRDITAKVINILKIVLNIFASWYSAAPAPRASPRRPRRARLTKSRRNMDGISTTCVWHHKQGISLISRAPKPCDGMPLGRFPPRMATYYFKIIFIWETNYNKQVMKQRGQRIYNSRGDCIVEHESNLCYVTKDDTCLTRDHIFH